MMTAKCAPAFHRFGEMHRGRYVGEFAGPHNSRNSEAMDQMQSMFAGMTGQRPKYRAPVW